MMKSALVLALAAGAAVALAQSEVPPVTSEALQELILLDNLVADSQQLQNFALAHPGNTRVFSSPGHNDTINWIYETIDALDYYDVYIQPFEALYSSGNESLVVNGVEYNATLMTYTPSGSAEAAVVSVNNLGCEEADFPPEVADSIALIQRGECTFALKTTNALVAGAVGVIIYNNVPGPIAGTLGGAGDYAPTVGVPIEEGEAILAMLSNGTDVTATLDVNSLMENRTTYNVIAETRGGDHDNVLALGAHSDSVEAGPGINDDGSGVVGILNVAVALANFSVTNAVRFCWWSAEEFGLLGSEHYVQTLNESATEIAKVRAYLNFDMIASSNYAYMIYDGDGSTFNLSGPDGSAEIEAMFQDFYEARDIKFNATAFDGRSDYGPFLDVGIPAGGLFTGAEEVKTAGDQVIWGGIADIAYDFYYHAAGDDIFNLALDAFLLNTQSIANSVAIYATSWDTLPAPPSASERRRNVLKREVAVEEYKRREVEHAHHFDKRSSAASHSHANGACGHDKPVAL